MNHDVKDRILDACLEEVLGGQTPPDFTSRIMQSLDNRSDASSGNRVVQITSAALPGITEAASAVRVASRQSFAKKHARNNWLSVALATSIVAVVVSVGALLFQLIDRSHKGDDSLAEPKNKSNGIVDRDTTEKLAKNEDVTPPINLVDRRGVRNDAQNIAGTDKKPKPDLNSDATHQTPGPRQVLDSEVVALINNQLHAGWREFGVAPSGKADDETWCRRLFASLIGREPSEAELETFVADTSHDKKEVLVDRLLDDPAYSDEIAMHFASVWSDLLIGPAGGHRRGDLANRSGLERYLRNSFAGNKSLDTMARELISATGTGKPGSADFNGASNFLLAHIDQKGSTATAHVGRVFLGQRVKCAQCHTHAVGEQQLAQSDYWQLNSFFRQVDFERGSKVGEFALVDRDFDGEGDDPNDAEVYFEAADGRLQVAYPVFDGKAIPTSGYVDDVNRRQELAKLITESRQFDQALVNHFWKTFFIYDLPSDHQKDGELVDVLAQEFRTSGFSSKRIMRWMVLSDAFSLSSEFPASIEIDSPEFGGMALFSRYYQRTVETEPVAAGLASATKAFSDGSVNARRAWYGSFGPRANPAESIIAPELVAPGPELSVIRLDDREMIRRISATKNLGFSSMVDHLFWATVTRNPTDREMRLANKLFGANDKDSFAALEAIWLVLINSDEFVSE